MRGTFLRALNPLAASTMQQLKKLGGDNMFKNLGGVTKSLWGMVNNKSSGGLKNSFKEYFAGKKLTSRLGGESFPGKWLARGSAENVARISNIRKGVFGGAAAWAGLNLLDPDATTTRIANRGMEFGLGYGAFSIGKAAAFGKFGKAALPATKWVGRGLATAFGARMVGLI